MIDAVDILNGRIEELETKLQAVYEAGMSGIEHVGAANYASRESEAKRRLQNAMYGRGFHDHVAREALQESSDE